MNHQFFSVVNLLTKVLLVVGIQPQLIASTDPIVRNFEFTIGPAIADAVVLGLDHGSFGGDQFGNEDFTQVAGFFIDARDIGLEPYGFTWKIQGPVCMSVDFFIPV